MVGGTVSELTGGKFANGAMTGAFSRALNDDLHNDWGSSLRRLTDDYVGRVDAVPNSDIYEMHVYKNSAEFRRAVRTGRRLKKFEVGVMGPTGEWVSKHGHKRPPTLSASTEARIRSVVVQEARARGWLGAKGTVDISGDNLIREIRSGMNRTGSLRHLTALGQVLDPTAVVAGMFDTTVDRTCAIDPDHPAC